MATYAIGDIQGCYDELLQLLEKIHFNPNKDHLWFAGDLVNRGSQSLEVLRFIKGLGDHAIVVLGNHDFHLLALWKGYQRNSKENDSLAPILAAPDRDELLEWLRHRPLLHHDHKLNISLVHAGLPPQWTLKKALKYAREVEEILRKEPFEAFLANMYGNLPDQWSDDLIGWNRIRLMVNCFTRIRFCSTKGRLDLNMKGGLKTENPDYHPWFQIEGRKSRKNRIIFGHWSTLGLHHENNATSIDTGCLWGGTLTAMRIDTPTPQFISYNCPGQQQPGKD
ncbi:MAG: symmetrical bis(5'-nucleosyl)-tetraphosphatase [Gammaproteobacteria bacterium]|nr:symmetrical bis(5'-nucleosyl)-tetraphosphatase [Gammaproteobacteria bacterium]